MITCSDDILLLSFLRHRTSWNGNPRHSPGGARTLMFFVLFVFVLFFTVVFKQGIKRAKQHQLPY